MANINIGFNELKSEPESWPFSHEWFVGKHSQKCENPKTTDIRLIWLPHNLIMCRLIRFAHKHTYAHWTYSVQMDVSCWSNTHTHMKCLHTHTNINEVRETKLKWAKIQSFEITLGKINFGLSAIQSLLNMTTRTVVTNYAHNIWYIHKKQTHH